MNVGFFVEDTGYKNIHIENPEQGNPGIGGTWYEFALVADSLSRKQKDWNIYLYHYNLNFYPESCRIVQIEDIQNLFEQCGKDQIDILIYKAGKGNAWYTYLNSTGIKCLAWAHTFIGYEERKKIENSPWVLRLICVGREQYDNYIDEDIIEKSTCIYNMVCKSDSLYRKKCEKHTVTYMGALIPVKSFHKLARVWKKVLKNVPDAELNVIGTGNLYNKNSKLGTYGIAESDYEKSFIKYLIDRNGKIVKSVNFCGILDENKKDLILETAVGVVNPSTKSETFCISAVEFEQYGVPVCSGRKNGLLDTVIHKKTGLLSMTSWGLARDITRLLKDRELNEYYGNCAYIYSESFSAENMIKLWIQCIRDASDGRRNVYVRPERNWIYNGKIFRYAVRFIRFDLGFRFFPSCGKMKYTLKKMIKRIVHKV